MIQKGGCVESLTPRTLVGEVRGQEKKDIDMKSSMILLTGAKVQSLE